MFMLGLGTYQQTDSSVTIHFQSSNESLSIYPLKVKPTLEDKS